jgi:ribosomal protein S18 acetylase RimI-like enzyme
LAINKNLSPNNKVSIRPFEPENQAIVKDLINSGLGEHWGWIDPTQNPDLNDIAFSYQNDVFLVAWLDGEIIGTGALVWRSESTGEIVRMSVSSNYRRQGTGTLILNTLVTKAVDLGFREVILETTKTWQGVIDFYRTYGFRITQYTDEDVYFSLLLRGSS